MLSLNSYQMPTTCHKTGASLCTPDGFAIAQRVARLKRELAANTAKQAQYKGGK